MRKRKERKSVTIFTLDADVKYHFKAACAKRGKTMIQVITKLMKQYTKDKGEDK